MEQRKFEGIFIPKAVWEDRNLSMNEKGLLMEINSLDATEAHCYASNAYLANFLGCSEDTVSRGVKKLFELGYLSIGMKKTHTGSARIIVSRLDDPLRKLPTPSPQKADTPSPQFAVHSIRSTLKGSKKDREEYPQDSHPLILATLLMTEHRKTDEKFLIGKERETLQRWASDIDKLIRLDKRTPDEIRRVILWCQSPGCFWVSNILSGAKLREKFPQLIANVAKDGPVQKQDDDSWRFQDPRAERLRKEGLRA